MVSSEQLYRLVKGQVQAHPEIRSNSGLTERFAYSEASAKEEEDW
jgi:hypothetical protein